MWNPDSRWWWAGTLLSLSPWPSDMEPHMAGDQGGADTVQSRAGMTWTITMDCWMELGGVVSQSLRLGGYLLNRGRRWHAFLINVQLHNANTASGTTVATADKAKVYILVPVPTTWPQCRHWSSTVLRGLSFGPQRNIALCLGLLTWYLFLTELGGNTTDDIFGHKPVLLIIIVISVFQFLHWGHI